jgi:hypothetical protein
VHREERQPVPANVSQKLTLPTRSWYMPRDLREPVVEPAEQREDGGAEDDEVEVRDDEVVSVSCWSNGIAANMIPLRPPMTKRR